MKEHLGHFYDKTSDFQQAQFDTLRDLIVATLSPSALEAVTSLIDIGSGTGSRTRQFFDIFPNLQMVLAIEPMVNMGGPAVRVLEDRWTAVTVDGSLSAHFEHTIAIQPSGPAVVLSRL